MLPRLTSNFLETRNSSFLFGLEKNRIISTQAGQYQQVSTAYIPPEGLYTHLKEFDFVKVFQTVDKNNDLTHQSRAITHEYIIIAYNADGSVLFVDFSRKELEDAKGTISKNYYDTISYEFEKHLAIEAQTNLKI